MSNYQSCQPLSIPDWQSWCHLFWKSTSGSCNNHICSESASLLIDTEVSKYCFGHDLHGSELKHWFSITYQDGLSLLIFLVMSFASAFPLTALYNITLPSFPIKHTYHYVSQHHLQLREPLFSTVSMLSAPSFILRVRNMDSSFSVATTIYIRDRCCWFCKDRMEGRHRHPA